MKRYILNNKWMLGLIFFTALLLAVCNIGLSFSMGKFTDAAVGLKKEQLLLYGILSLISLFLIFIIEKADIFLRNKCIEKCIISLKKDIYESILSSDDELENSSYYTNIIVNGLNTLRTDYYGNIFLCIGFILKIVLGAMALIYLNFYLFIAISTISFLPMVLNPILKKKVGSKKINYVEASKDQLQITTELFEKIDAIKMNNITQIFQNKINDSERKLEKSKFENDYNDGSIVALTKFLGMTAQIMCMLIAAFFVVNEKLTIGGMITSTQLLNYIFPSINLFNSRMIIIRAMENLKKEIEKILNYSVDKSIKEFENGDIVFEKFGVSLGEKILFNEADFLIKKGEKVAIIGKSGKGKSTLVKSLMGINRDFTGDIKIDKVSLRDINKCSLYENIAYAPQKPVIFKASLEDNISLFNEVDKIKLKAMIHRVNLSYLSGRVLNDADHLSLGEASRVAVARALIRDTKILIFDEPSASLDPLTSKLIEELILEIKDKTVIIITHNWDEEYLLKFDRIIKLE